MTIDTILCHDIWYEIVAFLRPFDLRELSKASAEFDKIIARVVLCKYVFIKGEPYKRYVEVYGEDIFIKTAKKMYLIRDTKIIDTYYMMSFPCYILGSRDYYKWFASIKNYATIFEINMDKKIISTGIKDPSSSFKYDGRSVVHFTVVLDNRKLSIKSDNK